MDKIVAIENNDNEIKGIFNILYTRILDGDR